jgi:hypothetical protein
MPLFIQRRRVCVDTDIVNCDCGGGPFSCGGSLTSVGHGLTG